MKIIFVADFFYGDFTGGAELNDYSLIQRFEALGHKIERVYCRDATPAFLEANRTANFIVGNFVTMHPTGREYFAENLNYIIYEHDHKYLKTRNPIYYKDFIAPSEDLANQKFYKNAKAVVCLTQLAVDVMKSNTGLENISKIGASVWTDSDLDYIIGLSSAEKNNLFAIMDSDNPIKKRQKCIDFCESRQVPYELIGDKNHRKFLEKLSKYKGLAFMTGHLETCCRLVVEAKMLNCQVVTQKRLIGAASEDWFTLDGIELIEAIRGVSQKAPQVFLKEFTE